jgi:hypothetical protein
MRSVLPVLATACLGAGLLGRRRLGGRAAANPSSLSWDTAWRGDLVYLFDMDRGIEILRLKGGPRESARLATVREPARRVDRLAAVPVRASTGDGALICPLFTTPS